MRRATTPSSIPSSIPCRSPSPVVVVVGHRRIGPSARDARVAHPRSPGARDVLRAAASRGSSALALASTPAERKKIGVNFVCLGNICRSPTAEAVFTECVRKANLDDRFDIDSCGTGGGNPNWYKPGGWSYHEGESSDPRMKEAASARGIAITSTSRPLRVDDFDRFEYIVGMDESNLGAIRLAASTWLPAMSDASLDYKVVLMSDYCRDHKVAKVPDPYYAGGFDKVIDLLVDACDGLLEEIRADHDL